MRITRKKTENTNSNLKELRFTVEEPIELMAFLIKKLPEKSRNTIKSYLIHKQVSVDRQITSQYNFMLKENQQVTIKTGSKVQETYKYNGLKIVYEDDHIIVIDKEEGLLSIATEKERKQTAYFILTEHVRKLNRKQRVYIVHRLDKDASGIMIFAKSVEMQEILQENWQKNKVSRFYAVLVEGKMENTEGTHTSWLVESKAFIMYSYPYDNGGQKAITHYKVVKSTADYSLMEVNIETGRKNQIRVHMKDLKHSIVGDKNYGATKNPIKRLGLHATSLEFIHPYTQEKMKFESPIPNCFFNLVNI